MPDIRNKLNIMIPMLVQYVISNLSHFRQVKLTYTTRAVSTSGNRQVLVSNMWSIWKLHSSEDVIVVALLEVFVMVLFLQGLVVSCTEIPSNWNFSGDLKAFYRWNFIFQLGSLLVRGCCLLMTFCVAVCHCVDFLKCSYSQH